MKRILFLLALLTQTIPGVAQDYDLLSGFRDWNTFRYTRTGVPSFFMQDTFTLCTEFDGTILFRGDENPSPDGSSISHALEFRKRGVETIKNSRRIISQQMVDIVTRDTIVETVGDAEGAGRNSLRGWLLPATMRNTPPCPGTPDTLRLYPYGHLYRYYTPTTADSLDESGGSLHLRTLRTSCREYAEIRELLVSRSLGLYEMWFLNSNSFEWTVDERYRLTVTPSVGSPEPLPDGISLSCYPNPASGNAVIQIVAEEAGSLRLFVHDLQGRVLRQLHDGRIATGVLDIRFDTHDLASGQYYCTALTERGMRTIPVVVLRKE